MVCLHTYTHTHANTHCSSNLRMNLIQYSCFHLSVLYCMGWQLDILRASWGKLASNYYNSRFIIISGCDYLSPDSTTLKRFVFSSFRSMSASQRDTTERRRQLEVKTRSMGLETCSCTWRMHHDLWKLRSLSFHWQRGHVVTDGKQQL